MENALADDQARRAVVNNGMALCSGLLMASSEMARFLRS
jgi:hypothetical protein